MGVYRGAEVTCGEEVYLRNITCSETQNGQRKRNSMAEVTGGNKETSLTRVSAKSSNRRRFVGTKSHPGQKTDKLAGKF